MDILTQIAEKIIREQESIIGPIALEQAKKVPGLSVNNENKIVVSGDQKVVIDGLIGKYKELFGLASVEVCRDAVKNLTTTLPKEQIPSLLV